MEEGESGKPIVSIFKITFKGNLLVPENLNEKQWLEEKKSILAQICDHLQRNLVPD